METKDFAEFHELVEQFSGEMKLTEICRQENVNYRRYISWRARNGYSTRRFPKAKAPVGLIEAEITDRAGVSLRPACRANVRIEFENGLLFERDDMEVNVLLEFIDKIRPVLCLS